MYVRENNIEMDNICYLLVNKMRWKCLFNSKIKWMAFLISRCIRDFSFLISYETDLRKIFHFSFFLTSLIFNQLKYIDEMKKKSQIFQYTHRYLVYVNFVVYYCYLKCEQKLRTLCVVDKDVDIVTEMFSYSNIFFPFFSWTHQKFFNIEQIIGRKKSRIFYSLNNGHTRLKKKSRELSGGRERKTFHPHLKNEIFFY